MREGKLRARRLRVNVHGLVGGHGAVFCYSAIGVVGERERGVKERSCGKEWQDGEGETWVERRAGGPYLCAARVLPSCGMQTGIVLGADKGQEAEAKQHPTTTHSSHPEQTPATRSVASRRSRPGLPAAGARGWGLPYRAV